MAKVKKEIIKNCPRCGWEFLGFRTELEKNNPHNTIEGCLECWKNAYTFLRKAFNRQETKLKALLEAKK